MKLAEEFRENARACLELSRKPDAPESRGHWVAMAQYWLNLAVEAEGEGREATAPGRPASAQRLKWQR